MFGSPTPSLGAPRKHIERKARNIRTKSSRKERRAEGGAPPQIDTVAAFRAIKATAPYLSSPILYFIFSLPRGVFPITDSSLETARRSFSTFGSAYVRMYVYIPGFINFKRIRHFALCAMLRKLSLYLFSLSLFLLQNTSRRAILSRIKNCIQS